jgi:hypothetical protein
MTLCRGTYGQCLHDGLKALSRSHLRRLVAHGPLEQKMHTAAWHRGPPSAVSTLSLDCESFSRSLGMPGMLAPKLVHFAIQVRATN